MEKDALGKMGTFDRGKMTSRTKQKDTFHGELSAKPHLWKWAVGAFKEPEGTRDDNFTPTLRHRPFSAATNFSYLWLTECARIRLAVCRSGRLLSLSDSGPGATSVPRPGSQHDERRLRLVHFPADENRAQWSTVGLVRPIRRWVGSTSTSACFRRRQTGSPVLLAFQFMDSWLFHVYPLRFEVPLSTRRENKWRSVNSEFQQFLHRASACAVYAIVSYCFDFIGRTSCVGRCSGTCSCSIVDTFGPARFPREIIWYGK